MRLLKGFLAGLVLAGIPAMMPAPAFAHGGGGGGHAFVGGGHGFGSGHAFERGSSTGRFSGRGDHGRFGDRGFRDRRVFFQQYGWPVYWYPDYSYDYSYLDNGPNNDYQYGDNSAASVQPESHGPAADHGPVVVITGNPRPIDSRANTAYVNSGYNSTEAAEQQKIGTQDPNEKIEPRADPRTVNSPPVPQPAQTAAKGTQTTPQAYAGVFGNLVLVSWLEDAGKDVIYVQNTETNDVQKITAKLRIN